MAISPRFATRIFLKGRCPPLPLGVEDGSIGIAGGYHAPCASSTIDGWRSTDRVAPPGRSLLRRLRPSPRFGSARTSRTGGVAAEGLGARGAEIRRPHHRY